MRAAAAPELVEGVAELVAVLEPPLVAEAVDWEEAALDELLTTSALAFLDPHTKDWQKV